MALRQYYWNPRQTNQIFVDETRSVYAFNSRQEAGTWSDLHVHTNWGELTYVASGSIVMCTGTNNFLAQNQRAVWIPPGLQHEWYMPEASHNRTLFIHPAVLSKFPRFRTYHALEMTSLLRELIFAMDNLMISFDTQEDLRLVQVLIDRLAYSKEVDSPLLMPCEHRLVELCVEALSTPDQAIRLADWLARLNISEKTLERLFIRQTGQTFGKWIQNMRMHCALADLSRGTDVTNVALNCGYTSVSAFIATFKKQFGTTPGSINKQVKK